MNMPRNTYAIIYGSDSEIATFMADRPYEAVHQFCKWGPVSPDYDANYHAITDVKLLVSSIWDWRIPEVEERVRAKLEQLITD